VLVPTTLGSAAVSGTITSALPIATEAGVEHEPIAGPS
jgi:hypothetical protein